MKLYIKSKNKNRSNLCVDICITLKISKSAYQLIKLEFPSTSKYFIHLCITLKLQKENICQYVIYSIRNFKERKFKIDQK